MPDRYYYVLGKEAYFRFTESDHVLFWYSTSMSVVPVQCYSARESGFTTMPISPEDYRSRVLDGTFKRVGDDAQLAELMLLGV